MSKILAISSILITSFFFIGFLVLFKINPQTYNELNNLSLAAYNIVGMKYRLWAACAIYGTIGLLNIIFCASLFLSTPNKSAFLIGKILMLVAGLVWLSFAILPYDPETEIGNHLLLIRVIVMIMASLMGLIFIGSEMHYLSTGRFLKWYTLLSGFSILALGFMSTFVYNDTTWIRTNISFTIYFTWFGVLGALALVRTKASTAPTP
jgi:hypothetical protein